MNDPTAPMDAVEALDRLVVECIGRIERDGIAALDVVCAAHPEYATALRRQIGRLGKLGLLSALPQTGGAADDEPMHVAGFRIERMIGGGGMGVVYVARELELGREVALKVIRPELLLFPGSRDRFRREVVTIARLDHPGIVPVFAFGEENGVPWFSMPRIRGVSLDTVFRALADRDPTTLQGADVHAAIVAAVERGEPGAEAQATLPPIFAGSFEHACLRIVRQVADALEHAHRSGVIHRDVKPSNIMVTPAGRAMLLDFGLAWSESAPRVTGSGSHMGSLHYMAPEVLRSDARAATARSDVYALGVTLFEMLALRHAFEGTEHEVRARILDGATTSPRRWNRTLAKDAAAVCLVAMNVEPARRYARAGDFARDLDNVLDGRPVEARPASTAYVVARWATRHKAATAAIALLTVLVIGGPIGYALFANRERERLEAKQARVDAWYGRATKAVDTLLTRVGDEALRDVPQVEHVRRKLLEDALAFYREALTTEEGSGPEVAIEAAKVKTKAATLCRELGDVASAERYAAESFDTLRATLQSARDVDAARFALCDAARELATMRNMKQDEAGGRDALAVALAEIEKAPDSPARRRVAAQLHYGMSAVSGRDPNERLAHLQAALRLADSLGDPARMDPDDVRMLAAINNQLGHSHHEFKNFADKEASIRRGFELLESLVEREPANREDARRLATERADLAGLRQDAGAFDEARGLYLEAIEFWKKESADFPGVPAYRRNLGMNRYNLGRAMRDRRMVPEATDLLRLALADFEPLVAQYPDDPGNQMMVTVATFELGILLEMSNQLPEALELVRRAVAEVETSLAREPDITRHRTQLAGYLHSQARLESALGDPDQALALWQRSRDIQRDVLARVPNDEGARDGLRHHEWALAEVYLGRGNHGDAAVAADALAAVFPEGHADAPVEHARAAEFFATCATVALDDETLGDNKRAALVEHYEQRALDLLRDAIRLGFTQVDVVRKKSAFERLAERPEFEAVLSAAKVP